MLRFIKSAAFGAAAGDHDGALTSACCCDSIGILSIQARETAGLIPPVAAPGLDALSWACTGPVVSVCGMVPVCGMVSVCASVSVSRVPRKCSQFDCVRVGWATEGRIFSTCIDCCVELLVLLLLGIGVI